MAKFYAGEILDFEPDRPFFAMIMKVNEVNSDEATSAVTELNEEFGLNMQPQPFYLLSKLGGTFSFLTSEDSLLSGHPRPRALLHASTSQPAQA